MFGAIIGFLLGMGIGHEDARKRFQRKLTAFVEARGIRFVDREGNDVPLPELIAEARKR